MKKIYAQPTISDLGSAAALTRNGFSEGNDNGEGKSGGSGGKGGKK
jgi:hypothetical protein